MKTTKMLLWILIVIIASNISIAVETEEVRGISLSNSGTITNSYGPLITMNESQIILNVTKHSSATVTQVAIYNRSDSDTRLANATFVGDVAVFEDEIILLAGSEYIISTDKGGSSYTRRYGTKALVQGTVMNWTNACVMDTFSGGFPTNVVSCNIGEVHNVESIWFKDAPVPDTNFTITAQDNYGNTINTFNATINGTTYQSNATGTIITNIYNQNTQLWNITFVAENHTTRTYTNYNVTNNLQAELISNALNYLKISVYDYWNTSTLQDITIEVNGTNYTSNPYQELITNYVTYQNDSEILTIKIWDNDNLYRDHDTTINVTTTNREFNISMLPNQLQLWFMTNFNNTPQNVFGYIADLEKRQDFNATSFLVYQQNLTEGKINVRINTIAGTGDNWTQYYEYINDDTTIINESIEILNNADWTIDVKAVDHANRPLEDVTIKVLWADYSLDAWKNGRLLGQRLTKADGTTYFVGDDGSELFFIVSKNGYQTISQGISLSDESWTRTDSLTFKMTEILDIDQYKPIFFIQNTITDKTQNINGSIIYQGENTVSITTTYRQSLGLNAKTIQEDTLNRYLFTLESGTDYSSITSDNITTLLYINGTLTETRTITYDGTTKTDINIPTGLPNGVLNFLIVLMIIAISSVMNMFVKIESTPNIGKDTFMILGIIAGLIPPFNFLWLSFINALYFLMKGIRKLISE